MKKKGILLALCLVALFFAWSFFFSETARGDLASHLKDLSHSLDSRALPIEVWYTADFAALTLPSGRLMPQAISDLRSWLAGFKARVETYRAVPGMSDLGTLLDQATVGVITEGQFPDVRVFLIDAQARSTTQGEFEGGLKIFFLGSSQWRSMMPQGKAAMYLREDDALFVPALKFRSVAMQDGVILHEVKHALQARQIRRLLGSSAVLPQVYESNIATDYGSDMETEAHRLESGILDFVTKGEYEKRLYRIVSKYSAADASEFLLQVKPADVVFLDELLPGSGGAEIDIRLFQYLFALGDVWIQKNVPDKERQKTVSRKLYREFYSAYAK